MSYSNFPNQFRVMTFETSETVQLGRYKVGQATELKYVVMDLFKVGTMGGSETLTMKLYGSNLYSGTAIATSSAFTLSGASYLSNSNAIGQIRFTFNREQLNPNLWYYVAITSSNYTRNGDTYYLGAVLDWPNAVSTIYGAPSPARLSFVGYKDYTISA